MDTYTYMADWGLGVVLGLGLGISLVLIDSYTPRLLLVLSILTSTLNLYSHGLFYHQAFTLGYFLLSV
jgi:hypothetical protein